MDIIRAYAVKNLCYITAQKMKPAGIVVHSTGVNNPNLNRYVDCQEEVGVNKYNNHWNTATPEGRRVCVHAFIGYDKDKNVRVAEILPLNICCWGVGNGTNGSYNYSPAYIQFEICEDDLQNEVYYRKAFAVATEYVAHLCKEYGLSADMVISHKEAHKKGYGSNHCDPEHWMKNYGETMDDFRNAVSKILKTKDDKIENISETVTVEGRLFKNGDLVSIKEGATYYNGTIIPLWVQKQQWYVKGNSNTDRIIVDKNEKGTNAICSPIHKKYLNLVKAATIQDAVNMTDKCKTPYLVKVTISSLNIRKGAGINYAISDCITDKGVYTIIEEKSGQGASCWGRLKSGAGWISLDYVKKI